MGILLLEINICSMVILLIVVHFQFNVLWPWLLGNVLTQISYIWQEETMRLNKLIWSMASKEKLKPNTKTQVFMKHFQSYFVAFHWLMFSIKELWSVMVDYQVKMMSLWKIFNLFKDILNHQKEELCVIYYGLTLSLVLDVNPAKEVYLWDLVKMLPISS